MKTPRHYFIFNKNGNGGEQLSLETTFEDGYMIQQLSLQSYGCNASICFSDLMTPDILRKLANELDEIKSKNLK